MLKVSKVTYEAKKQELTVTFHDAAAEDMEPFAKEHAEEGCRLTVETYSECSGDGCREHVLIADMSPEDRVKPNWYSVHCPGCAAGKLKAEELTAELAAEPEHTYTQEELGIMFKVAGSWDRQRFEKAHCHINADGDIVEPEPEED